MIGNSGGKLWFLGLVLAGVLAGTLTAQQPAPMGGAAAPAPAPAAPEAWPDFPLKMKSDGRPDHTDMPRGPGFYFYTPKLILLVLVFLAWVKTTEWASVDCEANGLPYVIWNSANFFPFLAGFLIFAITVPWFLLGFFVLLLAWLVPLGMYIHARNEKVRPSAQILTPDWFRAIAANPAALFGGQAVEAKAKQAHEEGPPVNFLAHGGTDQENQANAILARQSPGYLVCKEVFVEGVNRRAEKIVLDYTQAGVAVKYQIDGVLFDAPARDRESGDVMLAVFKKLANRNPDDRVKKQEGRLFAEYQGRKHQLDLVSQGTQTGERAILSFPPEKFEVKSLVELGMREKMLEQLKEVLTAETGMFLVSSLPSGGLTMTFTTLLKSQDRYMRDFVAVDDVRKKEPEIENIAVETYDGGAGETPMKNLVSLLRKMPNVMVLREIPDGETFKTLAQQSQEEKLLVLTSLRAKEAPEAILRVLALKPPPPPKLIGDTLLGVLNQRLIRKLCESCKEGYTPTPDLLAKLGIPAGRVAALYRERQPHKDPNTQPPEPCQVCGGIGYKGRTAIYELLVIDQGMRDVIAKAPTIENLRAAGKKAGWRNIQEEGIVLVAKGVTSITELQRVLKA